MNIKFLHSPKKFSRPLKPLAPNLKFTHKYLVILMILQDINFAYQDPVFWCQTTSLGCPVDSNTLLHNRPSGFTCFRFETAKGMGT